MKKSNFIFSIFTLMVFIGMTVCAEAQERGSSERQIEITKEQYESASPERQADIKENPHRYKIVDRPTREAQDRPVRQRQSAYETKTLDDGTTITILTQEQFEALPPARQQFIKENPDRFKVSDKKDRQSRPE